jgi:hypothetical protein
MLPPSQPIRRSKSSDSGPVGRNAPGYDKNGKKRGANFIGRVPLKRQDFEDARFWQEVRAYASIPNVARERYAGQFVAVYNGNIVDSDPDEAVLIDRFYRTFGYVPVLIHAVGVEDSVVDLLD